MYWRSGKTSTLDPSEQGIYTKATRITEFNKAERRKINKQKLFLCLYTSSELSEIEI